MSQINVEIYHSNQLTFPIKARRFATLLGVWKAPTAFFTLSSAKHNPNRAYSEPPRFHWEGELSPMVY